MYPLSLKICAFLSVVATFMGATYASECLSDQPQQEHMYAQHMEGELRDLYAEFSNLYEIEGNSVMLKDEHTEEQELDLGLLIAIKNHPGNHENIDALDTYINDFFAKSMYEPKDLVGPLYEAFFAVCDVNENGITSLKAEYSKEFAAGVLRVIIQEDPAQGNIKMMNQLYGSASF